MTPRPHVPVFQFVETAQRTKHPYGYGMILLCVGALINWLGLAENYVEPVRYVGVACIVMGAFLICLSMCCWLRKPVQFQEDDHGSIHTIEVPATSSTTVQPKPPDYNTLSDSPPTYDDAIKLAPVLLLQTTTPKPAESPPNYSSITVRS